MRLVDLSKHWKREAWQITPLLYTPLIMVTTWATADLRQVVALRGVSASTDGGF